MYYADADVRVLSIIVYTFAVKKQITSHIAVLCSPIVVNSRAIDFYITCTCVIVTHSIMASGGCVLISAVLLFFCVAVSNAHESDLLVLTTADRLREELRKEMSYSLCNDTAIIEELKEYINNSVREVIKQTLTDLFQPPFCVTPVITPSYPASSCEVILRLAPNSPSGLYWINGTNGIAKQVYCDMERSCKGVGGGWMRVASINMSDSNSVCPSGLKTLETPQRLCAIENDGPGCSSAIFPIHGIQYSKVCGKIIGYQKETPNAFDSYTRGQTTIDSYYVDGISLTHGCNPRKHIWTFAAALHEYNSNPSSLCPCINTQINPPPPEVPPFIGEDYFCDTGTEDRYQYIFYPDDPLWDGAGCGLNSTCCSFNSPPWFLQDISPPTNEDIEIRLCSDQDRGNEDITFEILELYVQ